jgi:hypothetical protein
MVKSSMDLNDTVTIRLESTTSSSPRSDGDATSATFFYFRRDQIKVVPKREGGTTRSFYLPLEGVLSSLQKSRRPVVQGRADSGSANVYQQSNSFPCFRLGLFFIGGFVLAFFDGGSLVCTTYLII